MTSRTRSVALALAATMAVLLVPVLALGGPSENPLAFPAILTSFAVLVACVMGSPRFGVLITGPLVVAAGLAVLWADIPVLAALVMAGTAFARGYLSRWGLQNAATSAAIAIAFLVAEPPATSGSWSMSPALGTAVAVLGTAAWALLLLWLVRKHLPSLPRHPVGQRRAIWFAVFTAALTGLAAWFVSSRQLEHAGGWFIMTILIVMQPFAKDSFTRSLERGAGTALGFVLAFGIGVLIDGDSHQAQVAVAIGLLALLAAMYLIITGKRYWIYATALTMAVVLLEGASTSIVQTDVVRLSATLAGVAVVLVIIAVLQPIGTRIFSHTSDAVSAK